MRIGSVISTTLANARRTIKMYLFGVAKDVRESMPYGYDSCPVQGVTAIYTTTGTDDYRYIVGYENTYQITTAGQTRIYSTDTDGGNSFNIFLDNNGQCYLGHPIDFSSYNDYLTKFNEMQTAFNQFRDDFNNFITTEYNSHTHPSAAGETSAPVILATPTEADMSGAKTDNIHVY